MTLQEYIKTGKREKGSAAIDASDIAERFGVSLSGARKWIYGQRQPPLHVALEIVEMTGRQVELETLVKGRSA